MGVINYTYSVPYLILLGYLSVLMFLEFRLLKFEKDTKYIRWATIIGFLLFFGFRGFVYTDWIMYYSLFDKLPTIWDGGIISVFSTDFSEDFATDVNVGQAGIELGFVYFSVILKSIFPNYFAYIFINSLVDIILLNIFVKRYSRYYALSFILFIVFGGLGMEFNLLRNIKAIFLFLISLKYLQEQRLLPYFIINLLGFLFHSSALVFFPLYFILNRQWPKWLVWSIFICGNIIFLLQIGYLETISLAFADLIGGRMGVKMKLYFASDLYNQPYGFGLGYIERVITFLIIVIFQNRLIEQNKYNQIFINSFYFYFIIYFFFAELMIAVERLSLLFVYSYWILYPEVVGILKKAANKLLLVLFIVVYSILKLVQVNSNIFSKYDNLLFGIENYEERSMHIYNDLDAVLGRE